MSYSEDVLYEVLEEVKVKGLEKDFYKKLDEFKHQPKHKLNLHQNELFRRCAL